MEKDYITRNITIVLLIKKHSGYHIKKNYIGGACGMYGGQESSIQGFGRETCWKETTDLGLNGGIILKWINKWDAAAWTR